jgi:hypothetical protein
MIVRDEIDPCHTFEDIEQNTNPKHSKTDL